MKTVETLVDDIYSTISTGAEVPEEDFEKFSQSLSEIMKERLSGKPREPYLRLSNLGTACKRKLYYSIKHPELGEPLPPHTRLKFLIGDVWEAVLLFLAKASGHKVEGEQDKMDLHGVLGHRDAVIDGVTVDVKSASTYSFNKFKDGLTPETDAFGYLSQINSYIEAGKDDPLVTDKSRGAFLAGDKTLGHLTLDVHQKSEIDWEDRVSEAREILEQPSPPPRGFSDVPDGKSGNRKLGVQCSYCEFREACWPGLKTYAYASGPRYLTKVVREPKVPSDDPF